MKQCTKCKEIKDIGLFAKRSRSSDGFASWCKDCFAAHAKEKYHGVSERERKERNRAATKARAEEFLWHYFTDHPCVDCGNKNPLHLQFDHLRDKCYNVSEMLYLSVSRIEQEIAKCEVRCANCHQEMTAIRSGTWRHIRSVA